MVPNEKIKQQHNSLWYHPAFPEASEWTRISKIVAKCKTIYLLFLSLKNCGVSPVHIAPPFPLACRHYNSNITRVDCQTTYLYSFILPPLITVDWTRSGHLTQVGPIRVSSPKIWNWNWGIQSFFRWLDLQHGGRNEVRASSTSEENWTTVGSSSQREKEAWVQRWDRNKIILLHYDYSQIINIHPYTQVLEVKRKKFDLLEWYNCII